MDKANPDLIVFTGDNLSDNSKVQNLESFIKFMDKFKLPWAVVMGNHDYNSLATMQQQCAMYEQSKYCLFKKGNLQNSNGNYYYNIQFKNQLKFSLIFMDSQVTGFDESQVQWYRQTVCKITEQNNNTVLPSFVFFHIPTLQTVEAVQLYQNNQTTGTGQIREQVCAQEKETGFFDQVVNLNSTKALFYGHDHVNNAVIDYNGIKLCYGLKTGPNSYRDSDLNGGSLITIKSSGNFEIKNVFI